MKERTAGRLWIVILVLLVLACGITGSVAESGGEVLKLMRIPQEGDQMILFRMDRGTPGEMQAAVLSGASSLMTSAVLNEDLLILRLSRPLTAEERLEITLEVDKGPVQTHEVIVESQRNRKLEALEAKIPWMVETWDQQFASALREGTVYLPKLWIELPFVMYPDEAPEIHVTENGQETDISLPGGLPEGWHVCLAEGIPVETRECTWNELKRCWTGSGTFESVSIIRTGRKDNVTITINYSRDNDYLAEYPVLEYTRENGADVEAFNCYGWGTAREYLGSMYAVIGNEMQYYAEYNQDHSLRCYYDLTNGTEYDAEDNLTSGTEPEGFINPVVHRK